MGTYIRPSIKKILFAVKLPKCFKWVGRKINMHVVLLFFLYDYCCCLVVRFLGVDI